MNNRLLTKTVIIVSIIIIGVIIFHYADPTGYFDEQRLEQERIQEAQIQAAKENISPIHYKTAHNHIQSGMDIIKVATIIVVQQTVLTHQKILI